MALWLILLLISGVLLTVGFAVDYVQKRNDRRIYYDQLNSKTKKNFGVSSSFM